MGEAARPASNRARTIWVWPRAAAACPAQQRERRLGHGLSRQRLPHAAATAAAAAAAGGWGGVTRHECSAVAGSIEGDGACGQERARKGGIRRSVRAHGRICACVSLFACVEGVTHAGERRGALVQ